MGKVLIALAATALSTPSFAAVFLTADFDLNNPAFTSQYTPIVNGYNTNTAAGQYTVATNAYPFNPNFKSYGDATTGTGNYLIANGAAGTDTVWSNLVPVVLGAGTYTFSFKLSDACCETLNFGTGLGPGIDPAPPSLDIFLNGNKITPLALSLATGPAGVWYAKSQTFTLAAGATPATFAIVNARTEAAGNDFGLDDISLEGVTAAVPEPISWAMMVGGFGLMGATMRRRRADVTFA